jgi:uncharacterized protein (TIGR00369 family)
VTVDLSALVSSMPFSLGLGIELEAASPQEVRGRLAWAAERCTANGVMHGGALITLGDSVGGVCAFLNLPAGAGTSTIESKTNFFRALHSGYAHAVCRPLHVGRTVIVVQTDIYDDDERRVAQVTQTQAVLAPAG